MTLAMSERPAHVHRRGSAKFGNNEPRRRPQRHVIADVAYAAAAAQGIPSELARLECSCGAVMRAVEFQDHRASVGEPRIWAAGNPARELKRDRDDAA